MLEAFVTDAAVQLLTHLDVTGAPSAATALSAQDEAAIAADERELAELKDMWTSWELSTREHRAMRKTVEDRITTLHRKTIVRPTIEVLAALVGPHARACWDQLAAQGEWQRLDAVLRCCGSCSPRDHRQHRGKSGTFDYSRIDIEPQSPAFLHSLRVLLWCTKTSPARNMNSVIVSTAPAASPWRCPV